MARITASRTQRIFGGKLLEWIDAAGHETLLSFAQAIGITPAVVTHWVNDRPPSMDCLLYLEFEMKPHVPFAELERFAKPLIADPTWSLYLRIRGRIIEALWSDPPKVSRREWDRGSR